MRLVGEGGEIVPLARDALGGLEMMEGGLAALRSEDLHSLPSAVVGEQIQRLFRLVNMAQAEIARQVGHFDTVQGYAATGDFGIRPWLRHHCHLSYTQACNVVNTQRGLDSLPQAAEAFTAGDISHTHASMITITAQSLGERMESNAEKILVDAARSLDPAQLRIVITHLKHHLDQDGALRDAKHAHDCRQVHLSPLLDGMFGLDGMLDAEGGAALQTALNAVAGPSRAGDERTPQQRRADALVDLARGALDSGRLPGVRGQKPHLNVTVDVATLRDQPGARAAEMEWTQPVPGETARRIACDCSLTNVVTGEGGQPLWMSPERRVVSGRLLKAVTLRDRGCRFPGCDRPPAWCDAHHLVHWVHGGLTELRNLVLFCRRHHRMVHEGKWKIEFLDDGSMRAIPPAPPIPPVGAGLAPP